MNVSANFIFELENLLNKLAEGYEGRIGKLNFEYIGETKEQQCFRLMRKKEMLEDWNIK